MKKKRIIIIIAIVVLAVVACVTIVQHGNSKDNWVHKSFQGTVTDIAEEQDSTIISIVLLGTENEKNFIVNDSTTYSIEFQVGDEVIIESDYNTHEHNGVDVPYPVIMITDPTISDSPDSYE